MAYRCTYLLLPKVIIISGRLQLSPLVTVQLSEMLFLPSLLGCTAIYVFFEGEDVKVCRVVSVELVLLFCWVLDVIQLFSHLVGIMWPSHIQVEVRVVVDHQYVSLGNFILCNGKLICLLL